MRNRNAILICVIAKLLSGSVFMQAQTLKVELSPDKSKVDRSVSNGTATIFFESNVDDLSIVCTDENPDESILKFGDKFWVMHVNPKKDLDLDNVCYRNFLLKSPSSAEYYLTTPEIGNNQVLYYTVVLPNQFSTTLSAEYLFTKTAKHGIRLSFGKRIGGYVCYKWGEYKVKGENIDKVTMDYDVTNANLIGGIRTSFTAGLRLGLFQKETRTTHSALYLLVGGGYGEYGRQWNNQHLVGNSTYFYSDYIKGFDGEAAVQCVLFDWLCCSAGVDMVIGNGKISTDYQIGVGVNLNLDKIFNRKRSVR